jgi:predicted nucleic acid-binding protein
MKNIFLDVNIIIDYILSRGDSDDFDEMLANSERYNLYVSALTIHIVVYTLKIKKGSDLFVNLVNFISRLNIVRLDGNIVFKALETDFSDFEDLLQFHSASLYCDTIFTRDIKDFTKIKEITSSKIKIIDKYIPN